MQPQFLKALLKLLAESNEDLLDLDVLAQKTGYSKYHLCRAFHAATNEPLQTYMRRLRLARSAEALRRGDRILDVAIACGYQSQEAFHRAFTKMFNITPKALQNGQHHPSLLFKQPWLDSLMPPPALDCREESRDAFTLYGMGGVFSYEEIPDIIALWQSFQQRFPDYKQSYGVTLNHEADSTRFQYYAALPDTGIKMAKDLVVIEIPKQQYKVFRYQGTADSLLQAFNYIWGVWLPEQRRFNVSGIDFEQYPAGYDPESGSSWVDIYIPVTRR